MNNSRIARKYERLLFKGVPEAPEGIFERDDYSNVAMRPTGKSPLAPHARSSEGFTVVGHFVYDHQHQTETFVEAKETVK